jgi:hypothetical protein
MMIERNDTLILKIHNQHSQACGTPPEITNTVANQYVGYFANQYGEQWLFIYNAETRQALLFGGDAGWETQYPVVDGRVAELMLSQDEIMWLAACWRAATSLRETP